MKLTSRTPALRVGLAVGLAATLLALGAIAAAQPAPKSGGGFGFSNTGGPIDITADENENFQQKRMSVWKGNVIAIQGDDKLQTPLLEVYFAESRGRPAQSASAGGDMGHIERMEAEGPVYFVTPTEQARGDHGTYNALNDTITLIGNVVLLQDKNVVKGEKLVIEQKTGHSTLYAAPSRTEKGRVRGVFYPNNDTAKPAPAAPVKKP